MKSEVFFTDMRTRPGLSLPDKLEMLVKRAGIENLDCKDKFTVIKIHFGEMGNMAYLRPGYADRLVRILKGLGAKVYLSDSNTLYKGSRSNAVDHIETASRNGYNLLQVDAPVIIADGVKGTDCVDMPLTGGVHCSTARIGRAIADADVVVSLTHFKGHEQTGFGGTLKNIGMGAASVGGKLFLHCDSKPEIDLASCRGCKVCENNCAHDAIHVVDRKAVIDPAKCVGCGQCVASCLFGAASCKQDSSMRGLSEKIAEYTKAVVEGKPQFHVSLIVDVSPECDCWGHNDAPIAPNMGIAASFDPVALDQACADIAMEAPQLCGSNALQDAFQGKAGHGRAAGCHHEHGEKDVFKVVHPDTNWQDGLAHGEKIGLGSRDYTLIRI